MISTRLLKCGHWRAQIDFMSVDAIRECSRYDRNRCTPDMEFMMQLASMLSDKTLLKLASFVTDVLLRYISIHADT